jgi:hypothetical protein
MRATFRDELGNAASNCEFDMKAAYKAPQQTSSIRGSGRPAIGVR